MYRSIKLTSKSVNILVFNHKHQCFSLSTSIFQVLILITFTEILNEINFIAAKAELQLAGVKVFVLAVGEAIKSRDLLMSLAVRDFSDYVELVTSTEMADTHALNVAIIDW